MIVQAFHDAMETDWEGQPTQSAFEAYQWIIAKTDWVYWRRPTPPAELREQLFTSFEWCCRWLTLDPEEVRRVGPPREAGNVTTGTRFNEHAHVPGLAAIKTHWRIRRERYLANWAHYDGLELARLEREALKRERYKLKCQTIDLSDDKTLDPRGARVSGAGKATHHAAKLVGIGKTAENTYCVTERVPELLECSVSA